MKYRFKPIIGAPAPSTGTLPRGVISPLPCTGRLPHLLRSDAMAKAKPMPMTQEDLNALFLYNPETGELKWRTTGTGRRPDRVAGGVSALGYLVVGIRGKLYRVHRVIYKMVHGLEPDFIDHIDGDCLNNRIGNIRICSSSENSMNQKIHSNNKSGRKGVCRHKGKWLASICLNYRQIYLGYFDDIDEAAAAYAAASKKYHGEFGRIS